MRKSHLYGVSFIDAHSRMETMVSAKGSKAGSTGVSVVETASQLEFRKANEAIGLRVVEGKLTLLNRKVFNVLMYHAQQLKIVGQNAPIDTPAAKKYFWIPLSDLARDAHYDSKDTEFLKRQIEEMQDIKLVMENDRQWTSERLISSVTFVNPTGLKSRTGQVWFGFSFPPEVHENVMAPTTYTKLSILYQGLLRSGAALALYEICRRYATNPSKVTSVDSYEHWYGVLTGNPIPADGAELTPYKYFKRDVLKPAIAEVNSLTDIEVELIELKKGRRVACLQFRVLQKKQAQLEFPSPPIIDVELLERIMQFGLSQQDAMNFLAQVSADKLRACIAVVQNRMKSPSAAPLSSPAAYFRWALKQDAASLVVPSAVPSLINTGQPLQPSVLELFMAARANDALGLYKELDIVDRDVIFERFRKQCTVKVVAKDRALENGVTRSLLCTWYAQEMWGDPSVSEISRFVDLTVMPKAIK